MCHCLCLFQSYQLFLRGVGAVCIAGLWRCTMLSPVLSQCASVVKPCVSVVVSVCQCLRVWPSIISPQPGWGPRELLGVMPSDPLWSFISSFSLRCR